MADADYELTDAERRWIASLRQLATTRPPTLALWGGGDDTLAVVALTEDGGFMHDGEVICMVEPISIPAGGGDLDWTNIEDIERPWVHRGDLHNQ